MSKTTQTPIMIIRQWMETVSPRKFWRNIFCFCQFWVHTAQPSRSGSKIGGALVHNEMRTSLFYSLDFSPVENIARLWYQPGVGILSLELCLNLALFTGGGGHNGPKSLILAPQDIPDISGYQLGFGCQCVKANNNENPVTNQKIL